MSHSAPMQFRTARMGDIEAIMKIAMPTYAPVSPIPPDEDVLREALRGLITGRGPVGPGYVQVADCGGEVVGFLVGCLTPGWPVVRHKVARELCYFVLPEYRGSAAVRLMKNFIDWAKFQRCALIVMVSEAELEGERVGALYQRMGFARQETSYAMRLSDGR